MVPPPDAALGAAAVTTACGFAAVLAFVDVGNALLLLKLLSTAVLVLLATAAYCPVAWSKEYLALQERRQSRYASELMSWCTTLYIPYKLWLARPCSWKAPATSPAASYQVSVLRW